MGTKSMNLAWIVVTDFKKAVEFYTKVVGLKLMEVNEQYGWAELEGPQGGARIGIAQQCDQMDGIKAGQNAVITFTVDNIEASVTDFAKKGGKLIGTIQEVPGHVKMQTVCDADGNHFQLCEVIAHKLHKHEHGCCSH
jgi:predicted enzyme related to lactoylglutathione lyase